jgi:hypothetical protein
VSMRGAYYGKNCLTLGSPTSTTLRLPIGYGKVNAAVFKIYQETPDSIFTFGVNPRHTEATVFQNQVLRWQREQGLR